MIARFDQTLSADVPGPPDLVRDFYVDLDNIKHVHPLVVSVRGVARSETPDGYVQTYRVTDRIPLGAFTLPTSYTARLEVPATGPVRALASQFPAVRLRSVVSFDPIPAGTRITECMTISAPRPLAGITVRQAVAAHRELLSGIRCHFEQQRR